MSPGGISLQAKRPLCTRGEFVHGCGSCGGSESVGADPVVPQAGHDSGVSTCSIGQPSSSLPVHELITSRQRTLNSSCCCYSFTNSFLTLWDPMDCSTPGSSVLHHLPDFAQMSIESVMPSNYLILYCPLLLLPSIFASIEVFSNESVFRIMWPNYWSFSFSISPSNEYSGLIPFRIYRFDLLVVQGTLKGLLQHHSSKASILQCSAFFIVQLSHPYMTIGKTIALIRWKIVGKVMPLLLNMLSRLVITSLPRSKRLLISWLQSPPAVILEPKKIKSLTVSIVSHQFAMKWWDWMLWS